MIEREAKLVGVNRPDWRDKRKIILALEFQGLTDEQIMDIENRNLDVSIRIHSERRSLDANAYMWILTTKIALKLDSTPEEEHKRMVLRYSTAKLKPDGRPLILVTFKPDDVDYHEGYWRYYWDGDEIIGGREMHVWEYFQLKGTSEFDTREMSYFLNRVIEEARELGIETATPDEIARMNALYAKKCEKKHNH